MNTTARRFGTDVSNLPTSAFTTPKKTAPKEKASIAKKPVEAAKENTRPEVEIIQLDDEISVSTPKRTSNIKYKYERDFLLAFQKYCTQPIEGLIPEVQPGYVNPEIPEVQPTTRNWKRNSLTLPSSNYSAPQRLTSSVDESISPNGGVTFKPYSSMPSLTSNTSNLKLEIPPVGLNERSVEFLLPSPKSQLSMPTTPTSTNSSTPSVSPTAAIVMNLEWRKKSAKKSKPKETDQRRLAARQKQIDIGMNTPGYQRFVELFPIQESRKRDHPKIPDIYQVCSKRSWDGQVRKWRRQLHEFDPEGTLPLGESQEDLGSSGDDVEEEVESEEEEDSEISQPMLPVMTVVA